MSRYPSDGHLLSWACMCPRNDESSGQTDPAVLAGLADRRIKATKEELREALRGRPTRHHRFLLQLHLDQVDALDRATARIDQEVEADLNSFRGEKVHPNAQGLTLVESNALPVRLGGR